MNARKFAGPRLPLAIFVAAIVACDGTTSTGGQRDQSDASSSGSGPGAPPADEPACPTTTTGPTLHKGDVLDGEVWTAEASPHVVEMASSSR